MFTQIMMLNAMPKSIVRTKSSKSNRPNKSQSYMAPSDHRKERVKMLQEAFLQHPTVEAAMKQGEYEKVYNLLATKLDRNGFRRFFVAEEFTGVDIHTYFYIEDSLGRFEAANGNELLEWLESAAFGSQKWAILQNGVEISTAHIIDKSSEGYKTYRAALHTIT